MEKLKKAVECYIKRKERREHPDGEFDKAGRWYPDDDERCSCCNSVRRPSRAYPYSYMVHCRSIGHIANLYGVEEQELRKAVRKQNPPNPPKREGGDNYYKQVGRTEEGRLVSIFDGETEYKIGVTLNGKARQDHQGGYYCYSTEKEAKEAIFPESAKGLELERVLLVVRAEGQYCRYDNNKLSFSRITPLEVI